MGKNQSAVIISKRHNSGIAPKNSLEFCTDQDFAGHRIGVRWERWGYSGDGI